MNEPTKKPARFGDYIYILYKWKKVLIIDLMIVAILSTTYALLLPLDYKATATVMIPPDTQTGFVGLSSLLGSKSSLTSMGSRAFGLTNASEEILLGVL